jgi:hypothetical protein
VEWRAKEEVRWSWKKRREEDDSHLSQGVVIDLLEGMVNCTKTETNSELRTESSESIS